MRIRCATPVLIGATLLLSACDDRGSSPDGAASEAVKLDQFCSMEGLDQALRHTMIVVDASAIVPAAPEAFRTKNPGLFNLLTGLGDPQAVDSGAAAPRERITILAGTVAQGSLQPIFTGCLPAVADSEVASRQAAGDDGALDTYFGSDIRSAVRNSQDEFRRQFLVSIVRMAELTGSPAPENPNDFASSSFVTVLRMVGQPTRDEVGVRRIFLFTDVSRSLPTDLNDRRDARVRGFEAAKKAQLKLGKSDIYLVPVRGNLSDNARHFLTTFTLGSEGNLLRVGSFSPNALQQPPKTITYYRGELPAGPELKLPLELRVASAASGELVGSWISYTGSFGQRSTPITGQFVCTGVKRCSLRSDTRGGLGQMWSPEGALEPEPLPDGPFGGLRYLEAVEDPQRLRGRIYDPVIYVGPTGDITFEAKRVSN